MLLYRLVAKKEAFMALGYVVFVHLCLVVLLVLDFLFGTLTFGRVFMWYLVSMAITFGIGLINGLVPENGWRLRHRVNYVRRRIQRRWCEKSRGGDL